MANELNLLSADTYGIAYQKLVNQRIGTVKEMQQRVAELRSATNNVVPTQMKWGTYQTLVTDPSTWPELAYAMWAQTVQDARADFAQLVNVERVSATNLAIPANRLDWLDAVINECFTKPAGGETNVGIPIHTFVRFKSFDEPDPDMHDVTLSWRYDRWGRACQLDYVMHCPATENPDAQKAKSKKSAKVKAVKAAKSTTKSKSAKR